MMRMSDSEIVECDGKAFLLLNDDILKAANWHTGDMIRMMADKDTKEVMLKQIQSLIDADGQMIFDKLMELSKAYCKEHHIASHVDSADEIDLLEKMLAVIIGNMLKEKWLLDEMQGDNLEDVFNKCLRDLLMDATVKKYIYFDNFADVTSEGDYSNFRRTMAKETFDLKKQIKTFPHDPKKTSEMFLTDLETDLRGVLFDGKGYRF